ncbi:hypothetical protein ABL78_5920 [Leptomonas seymouri]|uniref:Uncharacterized protein n=1 Tax=Leptomonas seymouri TaxID=5684 RepID=A0A0N0P495_LEPSE|nr:hypothetical protein ABL78_5920 [Leptomonas seymouri]|eukprot:KPI85036.1 hypothetical protein ABL78_5920 [Leptomonas seymouri]
MSAPPSYKELFGVVSDYLTKGSDVQGAQFDAKEDGEPNCLNAFPFARKGLVGAHLIYDCTKLNTTLSSKVSGNFQSWKEYLPTITYKTKVKGTSNAIEVDTATGTVNVSAKHPVLNANWKTSLLDGGATEVSATTCVRPAVYGGASLIYDPKRSGLRDFTALIARLGCPNIYNGDVMGKFSSSSGFSIHMRIPLHQYVDAAISAERQRYIAGIQGRSPCGARLMMHANVTDGTYTMTTIRNVNDIWKITLTMTAPFFKDKNATAPRYGLKITHMDATD